MQDLELYGGEEQVGRLLLVGLQYIVLKPQNWIPNGFNSFQTQTFIFCVSQFKWCSNFLLQIVDQKTIIPFLPKCLLFFVGGCGNLQERLGNNRILYTEAGMKALRLGQQRNEALRKAAWQTSPWGQKFMAPRKWPKRGNVLGKVVGLGSFFVVSGYGFRPN